MSFCSYTPTRYLNNTDINSRFKVIYKAICSLQSTGTGTVTSVGLSMPSAFTVTNSPITSTGDLTVTGAGTTAQYIRGDGSLATYGGASTVPLSGLLAATATNTINNANFTQTWQWNTLTNTGLALSSSSTAALGAFNFQKLLTLTFTGAHVNNSVTSYAGYFSNQHTGTTSTNFGLVAEAFGGTINIGLAVPRGSLNVGLVGTETGVIKISGTTSGTATLTVPAVAGTPILTLPIITGTIALVENNVIRTTSNKSADFTAVAGNAYVLGGGAAIAYTITLPAVPVDGDLIKIYYDSAILGESWSTNTAYTRPNGTTSTSITQLSTILLQWDSANSKWRAIINL